MVVMITCHEPGCVNADIPIPMLNPADICICGPCNTEIYDKVVSYKDWNTALTEHWEYIDSINAGNA